MSQHLTTDAILALTVELANEFSRVIRTASVSYEARDDCPNCFTRAEVAAHVIRLANAVAFLVKHDPEPAEDLVKKVMRSFKNQLANSLDQAADQAPPDLLVH